MKKVIIRGQQLSREFSDESNRLVWQSFEWLSSLWHLLGHQTVQQRLPVSPVLEIFTCRNLSKSVRMIKFTKAIGMIENINAAHFGPNIEEYEIPGDHYHFQ